VGSNVLSLGRPDSRLTWSYGASWQDESEVDLQTGDFGDSRNAYGRSNEALFTEMQGELGSRVSVLGGARIEHYAGLPTQALPRGSIVVAVVPSRLALRVAAGRAFLVPNLTNQFLSNPSYQPNPDLKPMTSVSWEVGTILTTPDRALTLSVGYFHQRDDDLIRTVPADTGTKVTNKNLGAAQSVGVETELERWWSARWRAGLNLTWVKTKILDNAGLDTTDYPNGGSLPYVPSLTGSAFVSGDVSHAVSTLARVTLVGDQTVLTERFSGHRTTIGAHAALDMVIQWHLSQALDLYGRLNNALNTSYQAAFDKPGSPRTEVVGVRTRF
jgi:outer membrane receptor protein involved in Fe transport